MRETTTNHITYKTDIYQKFEDGQWRTYYTVPNQVQLYCRADEKSLSTIVINLDEIGIDTSTAFEASLNMDFDYGIVPMNNTKIRFTVYADGECLEEETTTQSGSTLIIPLTNWIRSAKNEIKINLELVEASEEFYSVSQYPIVFSINCYETEKRSHNKKSFPLVCGAREHVDLFTGDSVTEFPVIADENMGVTVSGIIKASDEDFHCGENVRLSINEKLVKNTETEIESDYLYTDSLGDKHLFKETLYYVKNGVKKIITDKSQIEITPDGELLYNDGTQIFEVKRKEASYCDLKATTKLEGFKSIDLFDSRIDEEKELEERIDSYKNALEQLVIVNDDGEKIMEMQEDLSNAGELKAEIEAEGVKHLLTKDEFNSFKSIIAQIEENSRNSKLVQNSIATSKQSLKNTLNSLYDTKNALLLQKVKLDNVGANSTTVQANRYIFVNRQIETIQSKSEANLLYLKYLYESIANGTTDTTGTTGTTGTNETVQVPEKMNDYNKGLFKSYVLNVKGQDVFHTLNIDGSGDTCKIQLDGAGNLYDNLDSAINSVSSSNVLVLTRAEADSLYALRKEKLLISRAQGDTRKNSSPIDSYINIIEQIETVSAQIGIVSSQLAALEKGNGVYKENWGDLLVQEKNLAEQRILLDEQLEIIKSRSAGNVETFLKYYKEYLLLVDKHKDLKMQMPVNYIVGENGAKGFNENGDLVVIYDKHGKYIAFEYEAYYVGTEKRYRVARIVDDKEQIMKLLYDNKNLLVNIVDSEGRTTSFEYSFTICCNLRRIIYPNKEYIELSAWKDYGTILSGKYEKSVVATFVRGVSSITNTSTVEEISFDGITVGEEKQISKLEFTYDDYKTTVSDDRKNKSIFEFDNDLNVISSIKVENLLVTDARKYSYENDKLASEIFPKNSCLHVQIEQFNFETDYTVAYDYDSFKKVIEKTTTPQEISNEMKIKTNTNYFYSDEDKLIKSVTVVEKMLNGVWEESLSETIVTLFEYNSKGLLVKKQSYTEGKELTKGISVEEHIYDKNGYETKTVTYNSLDPSSKLYKEYEVNEDGKTVGEFDQSGMFKTVFEGNTSVKPNGAKFSVGADVLSGNTAITMSTENGEENSIQRLYTNGLLTRVISGDCTYDYTYDHKGQIVNVKVNGEDYVSIQYSSSPNMDMECEILTFADGHTEKREFFPTSDEITIFDSNSSVFHIGMRDEGRVHTFVQLENDNLDEIISYTYDSQGRMTTASKKDSSNDEVYSENNWYDYEGNLVHKQVSIEGSVNHTFYEYDERTKKLKAVICDNGKISVNPLHDSLGRNRGKEISILNNSELSEDKIYSENITYLKQGDHATVLPLTISYGRKTANGNFAIKENVKYKYDSMGNITNVYENGQLVVEYKYDALSRLVRENNKKLGKTFVFSYDNMGNILTRTEYPFTLKDDDFLNELTGEVFEYGYENGMLVSYNGESILYGAVGIPAMYRGNALSWGLGNRLTGYGSNTFAYDTKGKRKAKNSIKYIYDIGDKLIRMENTNSGEYINFIYDNSSIIGFVHNENHYFYKKDLLGNVTEILDTTGTTVVKYTYDAWGNHKVLNPNGTENISTEFVGNINPIRYRSYYFDTETGLYYLQSRYYDPQTGRFISMDSIDYLDPETINGLNLYAYCLNNPIAFTDPSGHSALLIGLLIFTGAMTLGGAIYGGVSAGMAGGDVGDVLAGIGKGALNGLILGGGISLAIGGFAIGGTTILGSTMATYGLSISANMLEVAITQGKKSYHDGDNFWAGANDINNAMLANSGNILIGKPTLMSIPFYGTRMTSKIPAIFNVLVSYDLDKFFGLTTFLASAKATMLGKASLLGLVAGYGLTVWQYYNLIRSIVTTPDFENSRWILY